ncbi:hypothetical protein C1I95_29270 [Micromonospora craterilacus]|uniref:Transposase n=1 Tax=Micromonospora craterilacus TaxID=1655439 RepID=A0A2W2EIQ5_9ACTN|nr:transposase [Micromonospora craterilacus]PZG09187.1 hypothetical protein C1I95_29270 [Micromonospora craterilacus]
MAETRRRFDPEFRAGAVRIVRETGKSIAQVARDLGINDGTLANWVKKDREERGEAAGAGGLSEDERAELARCLCCSGKRASGSPRWWSMPATPRSRWGSGSSPRWGRSRRRSSHSPVCTSCAGRCWTRGGATRATSYAPIAFGPYSPVPSRSFRGVCAAHGR